MIVYNQAKRLVEVGISVIPIKTDGSKGPVIAWKEYQERLPKAKEIDQWFKHQEVGIAAIAGRVSGYLEVIDFDEQATFREWFALMEAQAPDLLQQLVVTLTPGPGVQVFYRNWDQVPGNLKLARRLDGNGGWEVLAETRGEGGYAIIPPSPAACHPNGKAYEMLHGDLTNLTALYEDERAILIELARSLNSYVEPERQETAPRASHSASTAGLSPGAAFNQNGGSLPVLEAAGWQVASTRGEVTYLRRPGKDRGISATLGAVAPGILYVFSSNASPFEADRSYDAFGVYARLKHGGDFRAATKALAAEGYGDPPKKRARHADADAPPIDLPSCIDLSPATPEELDWARRVVEADATGCWDTPHPAETDDAEVKPKIADIKLARQWVDAHADRFRFVEGDEWREWRGTHWERVSDSTVWHQIQDFLEKHPQKGCIEIKRRKITEIAFLASKLLGEGDRPVPRDRFDRCEGMIPLANGMLVIDTETLIEHRPAHLNTYVLPYAYEPGARSERFEEFLSECMLTESGETCQEWVDFLVDWMGYCLVPNSRAEAVLVNVGEGGNGKSVFLKLVQMLIGDRNCVSLDPNTLSRTPEYVRASLFGKLVAFMNEPDRRKFGECTNAIKEIVSGDPVEARAVRQEPFTFRPHVRLMIACNDIPAAHDLSQGFERRIYIIDWRYQPESPDTGLLDRFRDELPGILNLALLGLHRIKAARWRFTEPEESRKLKADYRRGEDTVAQFLADQCEVADPSRDDVWCQPMELFDRYSAWCRRAGYEAMTLHKFGKHLTKRLRYPEPVRGRNRVTKRLEMRRLGILLASKGDFYDDEEDCSAF